MGGEPRTALSVLAFPSEKLPGEVMYQMLAGAMEIFEEAGVALVGGHSVKDDEIKLGFAITGLINPEVAAALEKPKAGDVLVLTKPLGTGVLTFCQQIGRGHPPGMAAAEISMATLNKAAAEAMKEAGASACTDVTGFGLFAHLHRMLRQSRLGAEIFAERLPAFDGAIEALRQGVIPGAIERNREYVGEAIRVAPDVDEALVNLGFDAQTSGGLLIAVPRRAAGDVAAIPGPARRRRFCHRPDCRWHPTDKFLSSPAAEPVDALPQLPGRPADRHYQHQSHPENKSMKTSSSDSTAHHEGCCADMFKGEGAASSVGETQKAFGALIRSVQAGGVLSEKAKELILFSLVVHSRCHPCFDAHFRKARELGITQAELDEAAWCAIAMGGAPVKMFYQESLSQMTKP